MSSVARVMAFLTAVVVLFAGTSGAPAVARAPVVLAAASLQEGMSDAAAAWARQGHPRPVISFAASSALARQIDAGAPADVFISADEEWMDYLANHKLLLPGTRGVLARNRLVLIAPRTHAVNLRIARSFPLLQALGRGRLAMADPDTVPAGKYGKAALTALGVWPSVRGRIAPAENVRAALALVERGEAPLGIVYATDARASSRVRVVGLFPAGTHPPIRYPIARLRGSTSPEAEGFRHFLLSPAGQAIFARRGFVTG